MWHMVAHFEHIVIAKTGKQRWFNFTDSKWDINCYTTLSNNFEQRRIDELAKNIEELSCNHVKTGQFLIQLDQSTLAISKQQLLSYLSKDEKYVKYIVRNL